MLYNVPVHYYVREQEMTSITGHLWGIVDRVGKAILARRARKLFTRAFGQGNFDVTQEDFLCRPPHRNHVQVRLHSVNNRVLLVLESLVEGNELQFLSGKVNVCIACAKCHHELSASWDTWLPRSGLQFKDCIERFIRNSKLHICPK